MSKEIGTQSNKEVNKGIKDKYLNEVIILDVVALEKTIALNQFKL